VHPVADLNPLVGICRSQGHVVEVQHQGFAGGKHFVRLLHHIHRKAEITTQLVADDVKWRFEYAGDRGYGAGLGPEKLDLRAAMNTFS